MVNRNTDTIREVKDALKLQQLTDKLPDPIPVVEVNPKLVKKIEILKSTNKTTSGSVAVYTTPTTKDFYLVFLQLGFIKDAANDMATGGSMPVTATVNGSTVNLLNPAILTATAQENILTLAPEHPLKLDRGTAITTTGTFAAGNLVRTLLLMGYEEDSSNA